MNICILDINKFIKGDYKINHIILYISILQNSLIDVLRARMLFRDNSLYNTH